MGGIALPVIAFAPSTSAVAHAAAGHAAAGEVSCIGVQTNGYRPGLVNAPRPVTVTGASFLRSCSSTADPSITSGTSTLSMTGTFSCTSGTGTGTRTIAWSNGKSSTLTITSTISVNSHGQSVLSLTGKVTAGAFLGGRLKGTIVLFSVKPQACGTPEGLTSASGPLLLNITGA